MMVNILIIMNRNLFDPITENMERGIGRGFAGGQLSRPCDAAGCGSAGAPAVVFRVVSRFFVFGIAPVVPTRGYDMCAHLRADVGDPRIRPPGSAQVDLFNGRVGDQPAIQENKTKGLTGTGGSGGYIGIGEAAYLAMVEDRGGLSKNKIGGPFDKTIQIILMAVRGSSIERILVAEQPAMAEKAAIPLGV